MQFLKKPFTIVQVSLESYFNLHDHKLRCFHFNKAQMLVVDQLWNIFVLSREKNCIYKLYLCWPRLKSWISSMHHILVQTSFTRHISWLLCMVRHIDCFLQPVKIDCTLHIFISMFNEYILYTYKESSSKFILTCNQ